MSIEHFPEREKKTRKRRVRADVPPAVYNVPRFCDAHEISRTHLYKLWSEGRGPKFFRLGDERRITCEAAAEWRAMMMESAAA
jgi:hypothetical protein